MLAVMGVGPTIDSGDDILIQIVDKALAIAATKSGAWLVCRPGCTQCCIGPFPISQLDARRLRIGLMQMEDREPARAARISRRARDTIARIERDFPGDAATGILAESKEAEERFLGFANDEPCPALDPDTGECELYASRPMTCRTFGPPMRVGDEAVGVCELCFEGATEAEIATCEVEVDPANLESALVEQLERETGLRGQTIVAFCLASARDDSESRRGSG
jgi:Fe-S-cluster containining protein